MRHLEVKLGTVRYRPSHRTCLTVLGGEAICEWSDTVRLLHGTRLRNEHTKVKLPRTTEYKGLLLHPGD